ncbi:MAG: hypothetical protein NVS9B14_09910 [Candidatus Acidiferrum sp.]
MRRVKLGTRRKFRESPVRENDDYAKSVREEDSGDSGPDGGGSAIAGLGEGD